MKDKIKEILEEMKYFKAHYKDFNGCSVTLEYDGEQITQIIDYITNLQEENKEWSMIFDTFSKRPLAHRYLEEKKKELNNENLLCLDSETIYKDYYNLQDRIDKAIEYIYENAYDEDKKYAIDDIGETDLEDLLNILKGE